MSKENFEKALQFLFPSEGGYVNDKDDKGGPTNMGVTQSTYNSYRRNKGLSTKSVKEITREEAINLYYENYWKMSGADNISDPNMAVALFDTAVLHGPSMAKKYYEQSNGDLNKFLDIRQKIYDEIVAKDSSQKKFYQGWNNRVNNLRKNINNNKFSSQISNPDVNDNDKNILQNKDLFSLKDTSNNISEYENMSRLFKIGIEKYDIPSLNLPDFNNLMIDPYKESPVENPWDKIPMANPWKSVPTEAERFFTPQEIENMTSEEFTKNESAIMEQLRNGQIKTNSPEFDYQNYDRVYTREDIDKMSTSEYTKHEKEIMEQMNNIGIPSKNELPKGTKIYEKEKSYSTSSQDGKWVTINGNHVFIEK